jgi:hypothetical protein
LLMKMRKKLHYAKKNIPLGVDINMLGVLFITFNESILL